MRVLQVNNVDLTGKRFNGFDLIEPLRGHGIECTMAVLKKSSQSPAVFELSNGRADQVLISSVRELETHFGMNGVLYPWGEALARSEEFRSADVVHYHLIHNGLISLLDLPRLCSYKPSVWTFHDSWPLTAHCVQPCGCEGWLEGCKDCPRPDLPFVLPSAHSSTMWNTKAITYSNIDIDIVVATAPLLERVRQSPLSSCFPHVHHIPFSAGFLDVPSRRLCRRSLDIDERDFVLLFRADAAEVKGLKHLIDALALHSPARPTTLLTVDKTGLLASLDGDFNIREFGWVTDDVYAQLLGACDAVVTPYPWAVGFGLMATEAMAAGRAVICFDNTSIETIIQAPHCGIAARNGDATSLRKAIDSLMIDPEQCARRGRLGKDIADSLYREDHYVQQMADLYRAVVQRHSSQHPG